jgi:hypothetical protein
MQTPLLRRGKAVSKNRSQINGHPSFLAECFVFEFPDETSARNQIACHPRETLAFLRKWRLTAAIARVPGIPDIFLPIETLEVMAAFEPMVGVENPIAKLFFADTSLPATVLKTAVEMGESESRWGLVRLSDGRQVIMSSGMSGVLLAGVGIESTTNWKRHEFWHPADLLDFERDWRRQLELEGNSHIERRYRIHKPNTQDPWEYYTSSYRLIRGEDGLLYHLGVFVDRG